MAATVVGPQAGAAETFPAPDARFSGTFTTTLLNAADGSFATAIVSANANTADAYLTNFGFSIPAAAIITKLKLTAKGYATFSNGTGIRVGFSDFSGPAIDFVGVTTNTVLTASTTSNLPSVATLNGSTWHVLVRAYSNANVGGGSMDYVAVTVEYYLPPTVTTAAITGYSEGAGTASGGGNATADGGSPVTHKGICWNTAGSPTTADSHTDDGTGTGSFTSALTSLITSTKYHVRAYATNAYATSYGSEVTLDTAAYLAGALGRFTFWPRCLTVAEVLTDAGAGNTVYNRSRAKGTVVVQDTVLSRNGAPVPATHVKAGWWLQNLEMGSGKPLFVTGHSVDVSAGKNALTVGEDWMVDQIGVSMAQLLAIPATSAPDAVTADAVDPWTPDAAPDAAPDASADVGDDVGDDTSGAAGGGGMTDPGSIPEPPRRSSDGRR